MIALATINAGYTNENPEELRATLSYDKVAKRIYCEAFGLPAGELEVCPETVEQAENDIQALYGDQPVWDLQWIERNPGTITNSAD